jgi:hypothetical protein
MAQVYEVCITAHPMGEGIKGWGLKRGAAGHWFNFHTLRGFWVCNDGRARELARAVHAYRGSSVARSSGRIA